METMVLPKFENEFQMIFDLYFINTGKNGE